MHIVKLHPAFFREIYYPRQVNNIYFDTPDLAFFNANKYGIAARKKVRIRWYGDTFGHISAPKLEFKLKSGLVGDKWTFPLSAFTVNADLTIETLQQLFQTSQLPEPILQELKSLRPTLLNTYRRTYFLAANQLFRLTFDEQLTYHRINNYFNTFKIQHQTPNHFILELKYALPQDTAANEISQYFPFRMDKSSKYVNGIDFLK